MALLLYVVIVMLTFGKASSQQQDVVDLLTTLLANNEAAIALQQGPELAANLAGLLSYLNTTGNITGVFNSLSTDSQVCSLTTTLVTLLFESLSLTVLTNNRVSDACQTDMIIFIEELVRGNPSALRMFDATGKPGSDLADGQTKFLGSYEECVAINAVSYTSGIDGDQREREIFKGKYCSAIFLIPGVPQLFLRFGTGYLQLGVCVTDTCSNTDVQIITAIVERILFNRTVPYLPSVTCQEEKPDLEAGTITVICVLSFLCCLIIIGTFYDIYNRNTQGQTNYKIHGQHGNQSELEAIPKTKIADSNDKSAVTELHKNVIGTYIADLRDRKENKDFTDEPVRRLGVQTKHEDVRSPSTATRGTALEALKIRPCTNTTCMEKTAYIDSNEGSLLKSIKAFSVYTNGLNILKVERRHPLDALYGLKFLSLSWVLLSHSLFYVRRYDANGIPFALEKSNQWTFLVVLYGDNAVDSFFAISGLLVGYFTLLEIQRVKGPFKVNWFQFYFHRYWRLTPTYMLVMMFGAVLLPYLFNGPLWNSEGLDSTKDCKEVWWTNLLYINNYVREEAYCMGWSWYLADDMQFYWISPLLVVPFYYHAAAGLAICSLFLLAGAAVTGVLTYDKEFPVQYFSIEYMDKPVNLDDFYKYVYHPSHARMAPYLTGIITGYLLYRCRCSFKIHRIVNIIGWFVAVALTTTTVYSRYPFDGDNIFSRLESALFMSLQRIAWGVSICWIIFSCATGHGGWINRMLSWKPFLSLGRLTYCAYLIHVFVIEAFYGSRMVTSYFTDFEMIYLFLGHLTLTFGLSFIVSLMFESPMLQLEKVVWRKRK